MDLQLHDRVAIVTGAGRGLGRAAVQALMSEGMRVLAVVRTHEAERELSGALGDGERLATVRCDMRDTQALASVPEAALNAFGRLDVLVNNAGIAPAGAFLEQDPRVWDEVMAINVTAPALLARAAGAHMVSQRSGKVINVASTSGLLGKPTLVAYSSSKGAVIQFTKALAAEWAPHGVQVNAIAPGAFRTDAQRAVTESEEIMRRRLRKIPAGRMAEPAEIGPLVCLLSSPLSDFVSGAVLVSDGGEASKL